VVVSYSWILHIIILAMIKEIFVCKQVILAALRERVSNYDTPYYNTA